MIFLILFLPPLATSSLLYLVSGSLGYALIFGIVHMLGIIFVLALAKAAKGN
jgi:hypothetical protein